MKNLFKIKWPLFYFICITLLLLIIGLESSALLQSQELSKDKLEKMEKQELEKEKLREEIRKLQNENRKLKSFWDSVPGYATFITAIGAIIGVFATLWKLLQQRELDRQQRREESLRRFEEKFMSIIENLGHESPSVQASSAVSALTFLKPEYQIFHEQVFMILLANLKVHHPKEVQKLLISAFEKAIRIYLDLLQAKDIHVELDLSGAFLYRIDLSGLNISGADIGFSNLKYANLVDADLRRIYGIEVDLERARLSRANLHEARLRQAKLNEAQFHKSRLASASLKNAQLKKAQFQQADMQSAHLDKANLYGAKFEQADINDTYFYGAKFDQVALKSIIQSKNWEKAHFDKEIRDELEKLIRKNK